ncbi:hypothetical protein [Bradyrhizobium brasilense]|uniref:hypothetical protein n=1 Tax=Bradyrhizobium brasilense TaxID=1419277 RepID=UPI001E3137E0|nr:hypothetical protein [Bradyrhizobium brasilense]MCC8975159.1 hypothetical protein [Bradyrhizobium brasilense]
METVTSLIKLLAEGGWRLGVLLLLGSGAVILAHQLGLPEPGVLASYLGWASLGFIAGASITAVSAVAGIVSAVQRAITKALATKRYAGEKRKELEANLSSLSPEEVLLLVDIVESGVIRFKVSRLSPAYALLEKGILYRVDYSATEPMCEVPKLLRDERDQFITGAPKLRELYEQSRQR